MIRVNAVRGVAVCAMLLLAVTASAASFISIQSGDWSDPNTWGGSVPVSGDSVTITSSHVVTVTDNRLVLTVTLDSTAGNKMLVIQTGGTLTIERAIEPALSINAPSPGSTNVVRIDGGTLDTSNAGVSITGGTSASKIEYTALGGTATIAGDVAFAGTAANAQIDFGTSGGTLNVGRNLGNGGTILNSPSSQVVLNGTGAQTVNGYTFNHFTVNKATGTATLNGPITVNGDFTLTQGVLDDGGNQISLNGGATSTTAVGSLGILKLGSAANATTFPAPHGPVLLSSGSAVVYQSGAATQTIQSDFPYDRLYLATLGGNAGKVLSGASLQVNGELNVAKNGVNNTTLLLNGAALDANGDISGDGTLTVTTGTINLAGNWSTQSTLNAGTSTITYDGNGAQQLPGTTYHNLSIGKSGGTATLAGNLTVENLTVATGTLDLGANIATLTGDLAVFGSAALSSASATLKLNGTAVQTLTHSVGSIAVSNLEVNNPAGVSITGGDVSVTGSLLLNGGTLTTTDDLFVDVLATVTRNSGWIVGQLTMGLNPTPARRFHVGTATAYMPVDVDSGSAGTFIVEALDTPQPNSTGINRLNRYWIVDNSSTAAPLDSLTFNYNQTDFSNGTESKFHLARYATGWTQYGDVVNEVTNTAAVTNISSYAGDWAIGQRGSLGAAGVLAVTSVNGGSDPAVSAPFNVAVQARYDNGSAANVSGATSVSLAVLAGAGPLGGTTSGTISAGTNSVTISGVTYGTAENGVVLRASATAGDPVDFGDSTTFNVVSAPSTLTVTSINDSGAGTLRDAIASANSGACTSPCTIDFSVAGTITLASSLLVTASDLTINGFSAPGASPNTNAFGAASNAVLTVALDGSGGAPVGLDVQGATGFKVYGLAMKNFTSGVGSPLRFVFGPHTGSVVSGCYFGTSLSGLAAEANGYGIDLNVSASGITIGGTAPADRNVFGNNGGSTAGSAISAGSTSSNVIIAGNYIGLKADLSGTLGNANGISIVGGATGIAVGTASMGNVVSGNSNIGIIVQADGITVQNNIVGPAGSSNTTSFSNNNGIFFTGDGGTITNNTISGNGTGLYVGGDGNTVDNNRIGVAPDGTSSMGNFSAGVQLDGSAANNSIGTTSGNVIAHNQTGIGTTFTATGIGNTFRRNQVFSNSSRAIDLKLDGLTANDSTDADTGSNDLQNFPVLSAATYNAGNVSVKLSLDSSGGVNANFYVFDVYKADGSGQAVEYLGSSGCQAGNVFANLAFSVPAGSATVGSTVVATATAYSNAGCTTPSEGTSELSASATIGGDIHWIAGSGSWETAANWSPAVVPGSGYTAYIDNAGSYTVTINSNASAGSLHLGAATGTQTLQINAAQSLTLASASTVTANGILTHAGTNLGGNGALDVSGTLNWNGGNIFGAGGIVFQSGATLNIATATTHTLNGPTLTINSGATANWTAGAINLSNGGHIDNFGTFDIQTDNAMSDAGSAAGFDNLGTLRKSVTSGTTSLVNITLNHTGGTLDIQTGTLNAAGGTATAPIAVASGCELLIDDNTFTLGTGSSMTGAGKIHINGGTLAVAGSPIPIAHVALDSGTLGGSGIATTGSTGTWLWNGGTMSGGGTTRVENGGSLTISSALGKTLSNRTLSVQAGGSVTVNGSGTLSLASGATISNTGTIDDTVDVAINDAGSDGGISNSGLFKKSGGAGTTSFGNVDFTNSGTLKVLTGTLNPGNVTSSGALEVTGTLLIDDSVVTLTGGSDLYGAGLVQIAGGTLTVDAADTLPNVQLDNGTLNGTATFPITALTWNGGVMSGSGTTTIPNAAIATIAGASAKTLQRTLSIANGGTVNVTGSGAINMSGGSGIVNSGLLEITAAATFNDAGSGGDIDNNGIFRVSLASGTATLGNITLNNAGGAQVDLVNGTLNLADGVSSGSFALSPPAILLVDSNTYTLAAGTTVTGSGTVALSAGTLLVTGSVSIPNLNQSGGTIDGSGTLTLTGNSSWSTGTMQGGGTTAVASGATFTLSSFSAKALNNRTLSILSGATASLTGGGTINLVSGGNIANAGAFDITENNTFNDGGSGGNFVNTGTVTKSLATGPTTFSGIGFTNSGGLVELKSGTMTVTGDTFTQSGGTLKLWLGGTTPGTGFAQLSTNTTPTLSGTLEIALATPYQPNGGDTFRVLSAAAHSGDFIHPYTYPALTGGRTFSDAYDPSGLLLTVSGTADLSISKTAPASVTAGNPISYTLTVNNAGPDPATGVSVTDVLQTGHSGITAAGSGWTCNVVSLTVTCTAPSLSTGTAPSITINATAPSTPQTFTNVANVSAGNDSTPGNNSGSAIVTVNPLQADLSVGGTAPAGPVATGATVTFQFNVTNSGPNVATNVNFTATLPPSLTFVAATFGASTCTFVAPTVSCSAPSMNPTTFKLVNLDVTTTAAGTQTVTGSATATESDPNGTNNSLALSVIVAGSSLTVTNTNDSGAGSLRQALLDAQGGTCTPLPCAIGFNIAAGPYVIAPQSNLPVIGNQVILDATTQPGYAGVPVIEIDGSSAFTSTLLTLGGSGSTVRGFSLVGDTYGIEVTGSGNTIEANYIGLTPGGFGVPNVHGIRVTGSNNTIGGTTVAQRNLISGNNDGIVVIGGTGTAILGNSIHGHTQLGIDLAGDGVTPNDANDADSGPNGLQNFPTLGSVTLAGGGNVNVAYALDSSGSPTPVGSVRIEVFKADGTGEGQLLVHTACVAGNAFGSSLTFNDPTITAGTPVVATATSYTDAACTTVADGTSEFSNMVSACTPPAATITPGGPTTFCAGGSVVLTASSGSSWLWSNGATSPSITVTSGGTFTVQVSNGTCSATSAPVTVTVNPTPVVTITGPAATCAGAPVTLDAGPGFATYAWSTGANTRQITVSPASTQTFSVTVTDGNTCSASDTHLVTVTTTPVTTITAPASVCQSSSGNSASVPAQPGATYAWSIANGTITSAANGSAVTFTAGPSGQVTLNVTVTNGSCVAPGSANVSIVPSPAVAISGPASACPSTNFTLSVPASFATYVWSTGATTPSITVNQTDATHVYSVTVTNGAGCSATAAHTVTLTPPPNATITAPASAPASSTQSATVPAQPGATYLWQITNGTLTGGQGTNAITFTTAGSGTTAVEVLVMVGGCNASGLANVVVSEIPPSPCLATLVPLMAPADGASVASPVLLQWAQTGGSTSYDVFLNGTLYATVSTTSLSVTLPAGPATWRVVGHAGTCTYASSTRTFTVQENTTPSDPCAARTAATPIAPANGTVNTSSILFQWTAANRANGYRLRAAVDGAAPVVLGTTGETSLRATIARGTVVWWVEALYEGCASTESQRIQFTIPAAQSCGTAVPGLIAPAGGSTVTGGDVTFTWSGVAGAIGYELYLSLDSGAPTLIGTTTGATSLTRSVPEGELQWFVRVLVDRCPPRDSQTASFKYEQPRLCTDNQRPLLVEPVDGARGTSPLGFDWSDVANATSYGLYTVRGGNPPQLVATTTASHAVVSLGTGGRVRWFVRASFAAGCPSLDSAPRELEIVPTPAACAPLAPPVISAPAQVSAGTPLRIQWTPAAGATAYQLQLANDDAFTGAQTIDTDFTQYSLTPDAQTVYARVRAVDARCSTASVSAFGPPTAIFILPRTSSDGSTQVSQPAPITFTYVLGPEYAGQTFTAVARQPWLTVTPASGVVTAGGTTITVVATTTGLPLGTSIGGLTVTFSPPAAGGIATSGASILSPNFSVGLVTPVTPSSKDTPPPDALIIPAVAHAGGINARFQSDVRVSNTSAQLITYLLTFTPSGESGITQGQQTEFSIEPGHTIALDDILKSWFGGENSAVGTLEIRPLTQTAASTSSSAFSGLANLLTFASSRTFNVTANGTFGQYIPAIPFANFVGRERILSLQQIAQSSKYRTNLGLVEGSGHPASLIVRVFGESGQYLTEFNVDLRGGQHLQLNSFLREQGISTLNDGRVEIEVASGDGLVTAYASVLDNETSDPLLVTPVTLGQADAKKWVVPGVADLASGFGDWQTDMRLFNAGRTEVEATLTFHSQGGGEPKVRTLTIPAGQVRQFDRTLASLFDTGNDAGAVHITTAQPAKLIATARTYNQTTGGGTYGQFISAVTPDEAAGVESRPLQLLQVEESERFRSNIGLVEVSGKPVRLEISAIPPDTKFSVVTELELAPNEFRQLGSLLRSMGLDGTYNARVTVRVLEGEGRVTAYASVIDMKTNDPTYIPAQ